MKKLTTLLLILVFAVSLTGCGDQMSDTGDRIVRPGNLTVPLQGTWKLELLSTAETTLPQTDPSEKLTGSEIGFGADGIAFGDKFWSNVNYKVRRVDAQEYFLHKYTDALMAFDIRDKEVTVITASSEDKFLYEFVKAADDRYIVQIEDGFYSMIKVSDKFSGKPATSKLQSTGGQVEKAGVPAEVPRSGLLLGFRVPADGPVNGTVKTSAGFKYLTYWISSNSGAIGTVYSAPDIFLPRKDGFWRLEVGKGLGSEGLEDFLTAVSIPDSNMRKAMASSGLANSANSAVKRIETKLEKAILYVGNDYVCVENTIYTPNKGSSGTYLEKTLRTLPVDNLKNTEGIRFSDLTGENGILAMEGASADVLGLSNSNAISRVPGRIQEENFALFRKMGHWFFKGRISLSQDDPMTYMDYNINLIPPSNMVAYDMLHVPWTAIKDAVPQMIDAYTSPNKDIAVVITRTDILIYGIANGMLSEKPLKKIAAVNGGSIIMAEWATGDYVQNWEKAFVKNNTIRIEPEE